MGWGGGGFTGRRKRRRGGGLGGGKNVAGRVTVIRRPANAPAFVIPQPGPIYLADYVYTVEREG